MARTKQTRRQVPTNSRFNASTVAKVLMRARIQQASRRIQSFLRTNVQRRTQERAARREANFQNILLQGRRYDSASAIQRAARAFLGRRATNQGVAGALQQELNELSSVEPDMSGGISFPDDEESPPNQGVLAQIPAQTNHAYGQINITAMPTGPIGDNHVPIYNFSVRFRVDDPNVDMNMVQRAALQAILNTQPIFGHSNALNNVYGQVRLLRIPAAGMTNDLVTAMSPFDDISDEFEVSLELYEQSEDEIDPRVQAEIEFRYTFVFPDNNQVTPEMVRATTIAFRSMQSGSGSPRINHTNTQARFMAMQAIRGQRTNPRIADTPIGQRNAALQLAAEERRQIKLAARNQAYAIRKNARDLSKQTTKARKRVALGLPAVGPPDRGVKRPLTADQKARYNQKRRERYHEQKDTRGIYQDFKKKIFHHTSLDQFFQHSKAVMVVPNTHEEGLCLAMALLRSEQRLYDMQDFEIFESTPESTGSRSFRTFPLSDRVKGLLEHSPHYSFLARDEDGTYSGCLFNTFKPMRRNEGEDAKGALKYSLDMTDEEVQNWYFTAQGFVEYITESMRDALEEDFYEIDPNKEESFLQAVCDVMDIYICVYRAALQGKRCNVYKPQIRDDDIRKNGRYIEVVSIFISDEHASSITSLREFVKNRSSANRMHIQNYCLMCEKVTTANNCNIEACKKHFRECVEKKDGELACHSEDMQRKQYIKTYNPPQFSYRSKFKDFVCRTCREPIERTGCQLDHVCYIARPEKIDIINEYDIVVYDFEAAQMDIPGHSMKQHDVNLVCCRNAYVHPTLGDDRQHFDNLDDFMVWVLSQTNKARVYIAHNGGRYDVQFIMRYLETNLIPHSFIPAPSSIHAYLSVTVPFGAGNSATFLDFRNFMPSSLKNIGISFGLSLSKGDFPHRFNDGWRDLYEGRIPALDDARDFWCLDSKRTEEELAEFTEWYESQCLIYCTCNDETCTCGKTSWNFREQLLYYCWIDVDVLAEAVVKYRDNAMAFGTMSSKEDNCGWEPKSIDPYAHLTIAQMAMKLLLSGLPEPQMITITPNKVRLERCAKAIGWMERIQEKEGIHIRHIGNATTEYHCLATNRYIDGVCRESGVFYLCLNCTFHGCPTCHFDEIETGVDHPFRPGTYSAVYQDTRQFVESLFKYYGTGHVVVTWECAIDNLTPVELELGNIMKERDCFYGGRTEAFAPYTYANPAKGRQIKYKDVCSLYPYVCARKRLPTGVPIHLCGRNIDRERLVPDHPDAYFGFVKCQIIPNREDILGLLPRREETSGRLEFPLNPWIGCFGTEELCLAVRHGYVIGDVYEVYHWTEEESSDTLLRGYVSFFLRMKQEAEGWKKLGASSENPSEEEKDEVIERVFVENGHIARIRKENMEKNPTKRQLAKIFLNSLWGKFCQKPHKEHFVTIHGYQQFIKLWYDPTIDKSSFSFRHIGNNTWKVLYRTIDAYTKPNPKYNIYLAAKVTEWARTILHTEMLRVGAPNVLYCDTDSIMYECDDTEVLNGHGLGEWVDEYPNDRIVKLYVLAPKFYFLLKESGESLLKSKGVQMTLNNSRKINEERLIKQILEVLYPVLDENTGEVAEFQSYIEVDNMIIGVNSTNANLPYGCMLTRYTEPKKVRPVYSKRNVICMTPRQRSERPETLEAVTRVYTSPKGFHLDVEFLAELLYSFSI
jgi:hypothetical protein